ncbi:MAG: hypothetical protein AAGF46_05315, partial [Pseudomonadota bacterium]
PSLTMSAHAGIARRWACLLSASISGTVSAAQMPDWRETHAAHTVGDPRAQPTGPRVVEICCSVVVAAASGACMGRHPHDHVGAIVTSVHSRLFLAGGGNPKAVALAQR